MITDSHVTFGVVASGIAMATCYSHLNYGAKVRLIFVFAILKTLIINILERTENCQVCSTQKKYVPKSFTFSVRISV
jgi:hypothetical protein